MRPLDLGRGEQRSPSRFDWMLGEAFRELGRICRLVECKNGRHHVTSSARAASLVNCSASGVSSSPAMSSRAVADRHQPFADLARRVANERLERHAVSFQLAVQVLEVVGNLNGDRRHHATASRSRLGQPIALPSSTIALSSSTAVSSSMSRFRRPFSSTRAKNRIHELVASRARMEAAPVSGGEQLTSGLERAVGDAVDRFARLLGAGETDRDPISRAPVEQVGLELTESAALWPGVTNADHGVRELNSVVRTL